MHDISSVTSWSKQEHTRACQHQGVKRQGQDMGLKPKVKAKAGHSEGQGQGQKSGLEDKINIHGRLQAKLVLASIVECYS